VAFTEAGFLLPGVFAVDLFGTFFLTSEEFAGEDFFTVGFVALMAFAATFPLLFKAELVATVWVPLFFCPLFPVIFAASLDAIGAPFLTDLPPWDFPLACAPEVFFR